MAVLLFLQLVYLEGIHISANKSHQWFLILSTWITSTHSGRQTSGQYRETRISHPLKYTHIFIGPANIAITAMLAVLISIPQLHKLKVHWHIAADLSICYRKWAEEGGKFPVIISSLVYYICITCCIQSGNTENGLILQHGSTAQTSVVKSTVFLRLL